MKQLPNFLKIIIAGLMVASIVAIYLVLFLLVFSQLPGYMAVPLGLVSVVAPIFLWIEYNKKIVLRFENQMRSLAKDLGINFHKAPGRQSLFLNKFCSLSGTFHGYHLQIVPSLENRESDHWLPYLDITMSCANPLLYHLKIAPSDGKAKSTYASHDTTQTFANKFAMQTNQAVFWKDLALQNILMPYKVVVHGTFLLKDQALYYSEQVALNFYKLNTKQQRKQCERFKHLAELCYKLVVQIEKHTKTEP